MTPEYIGRYRVLDPVGTGAAGAVYRARDEQLGRDVAVKALHSLGMNALRDHLMRARFDNEVKALASFAHPNIVPVFDAGVDGDTPFLVMELAVGRSLSQRVRDQGPLSVTEARALGIQIAGALAAAHAAGIVHRDVKPGNVLETASGQWKLADFGVAHVPESSLTLSGQFVGSPAYAPPESLGSGRFSGRSDVYSLGATLYEALAGAPAYGEAGLLTPGALATDAGPRPLCELRPEVPRALSDVIDRALARNPAHRPDAHQLASLLAGETALPALPPRPIPRRALAIAALAIAALIAGILIGQDERPGAPPSALPAYSSGGKDLDKRDRRMEKAQHKLHKGDLRGAEREVDKILDRDPYDAEARALHDEIERQYEYYEDYDD